MPFTAHLSKCLVRVQGLPILRRQLAALEQNGIKNITVVTGFMADEVARYAVSEFPRLHFTFIRNPRFAETNTLYSLALAARVTQNTDAILQLNGDVIFHPRVVAGLIRDPNISKLAVQKKICGSEEIKCILASDGSAANLNKTCDPNRAIGEAIGINFFALKEWDAVSQFLLTHQNLYRKKYFEYSLEKSIAGGYNFFPYFIGSHHAIEIDFPEDLELAQSLASRLI